jgi:hypothetical protein
VPGPTAENGDGIYAVTYAGTVFHPGGLARPVEDPDKDQAVRNWIDAPSVPVFEN